MDKKPILFLLHGALGAAEQFDAWKPILEPHFSLIIPELEGHGKTPQPTERPFRIENFAENISAAIRQTGEEKVNIFGYSMGGYAALELAATRPKSIHKIFTLATKFDWNPDGAAKEVRMLDAGRIKEKIPAFAQTLSQRHTAIGWENHLAKTAEMMLHLGFSPTLTHEKLRQIPLPIRLSLGDRDTMVTLQETSDVFKILQNGELQVFPATSHPLEKVKPEKLLPSLLEFFKN